MEIETERLKIIADRSIVRFRCIATVSRRGPRPSSEHNRRNEHGESSDKDTPVLSASTKPGSDSQSDGDALGGEHAELSLQQQAFQVILFTPLIL